MVTLNPLDWSNLPNDEAIMPFPREEVTPPVIKMYFVFEAIRSGGGVEITWILMGYKDRKISWIGLKNRLGIFQNKNLPSVSGKLRESETLNLLM